MRQQQSANIFQEQSENHSRIMAEKDDLIQHLQNVITVKNKALEVMAPFIFLNLKKKIRFILIFLKKNKPLKLFCTISFLGDITSTYV